MRRISDGLYGLAHLHILHLRDHQCENDGERKTHKQRIKAQLQRVQQYCAELVGREKTLKVLQAYPWASRDAPSGRVIAEGHLYTVHRQIGKNEKIDRCRQKEQIKLPILPYSHQCAPSPRFYCSNMYRPVRPGTGTPFDCNHFTKHPYFNCRILLFRPYLFSSQGQSFHGVFRSLVLLT